MLLISLPMEKPMNLHPKGKINRKERVRIAGGILDELYPAPSIPLSHKDPFTLLVAVILSARATDRSVNAVTPVLFKLGSTPAAMTGLSVPKIRSIIRPVGLSPAKAKNIHETAKRILRDFGGRVPDTFEGLESLPGVGHKTASVVMSQAFGKPAFPVDTHIYRLARRWGLSRGKRVEQVEADLKKAFPESEWRKRHLQMIYFGREYCPARGHDAAVCPICSQVC
jgi:endonuclease-3